MLKSLSLEGADKVQALFDRAKNAIIQSVPRYMDKVVEEEAENVQMGYAEAMYDGDNDVTATSYRDAEGSWVISASGTTLLFIEFGTGIIFPHTSPIDHPFNFAGSWSIDHAQYLTDSEKLARHKGQWPYNGEWVDGNPSANVMYYEARRVSERVPELVGIEISRAVRYD